MGIFFVRLQHMKFPIFNFLYYNIDSIVLFFFYLSRFGGKETAHDVVAV